MGSGVAEDLPPRGGEAGAQGMSTLFLIAISFVIGLRLRQLSCETTKQNIMEAKMRRKT